MKSTERKLRKIIRNIVSEASVGMGPDRNLEVAKILLGGSNHMQLINILMQNIEDLPEGVNDTDLMNFVMYIKKILKVE